MLTAGKKIILSDNIFKLREARGCLIDAIWSGCTTEMSFTLKVNIFLPKQL